MGGKGDLGIDAAAVSVNGTLYTDPDALKDAIESHGQLDVHFIIVQARTTPTFSAETFGALGNNLEHVFTETPTTLPCSHLVKRLRACSDVIYGAGAKLHKGLPKAQRLLCRTGKSQLGGTRSTTQEKYRQTAKDRMVRARRDASCWIYGATRARSPSA
jgi:hypothetical protein